MNPYFCNGIVLWGAGDMTHRIWADIGELVLAIIDSNPKKIGKTFFGVPIISFAEYQKRFSERFILITPYAEPEIEATLQEAGVTHSFRLSDCPSEFSMPRNCDVIRRRLMKEMKEAGNCAIYGRSFYALLLSAWHAQEMGNVVDIYLPPDISTAYRTELQREFPKLPFHVYGELIKESSAHLGTLFVTDEWDFPQLRKDVQKELPLVNAFDITDREEAYFNPRLQAFKDIHKGESCFIVGLGPSLRAEDLTKIHEAGVKSISMNAISFIFDKTPWRPTYFATGDVEAFDDGSLANIDGLSLKYNFFADVFEDFWKNNTSQKTLKFHPERNVNRREPVRFSDDISHVIRFGGTITYVCMQIALYMGFSNIYLIGVDGFDPTRKDGLYRNFYSRPNEYTGGSGYISMVYPAYRVARQYAEAHGQQILNATRGGYLDMFERVDFDSLFS